MEEDHLVEVIGQEANLRSIITSLRYLSAFLLMKMTERYD
jgi:hypothetical protein